MSHEAHRRLGGTQSAGCIPVSVLAEQSTASPSGNSPSTDRLWEVVTLLTQANSKHDMQIKELQGEVFGREVVRKEEIEDNLVRIMKVAQGLGVTVSCQNKIADAVASIRNIIRN